MGIFLFFSNSVLHVRIKSIEHLLFEWRVVFSFIFRGIQ